MLGRCLSLLTLCGIKTSHSADGFILLLVIFHGRCEVANADFIADTLECAAKLLRDGQLGSATWRVADAGLLLRELCEVKGMCGVIGLDCASGMGAKLPVGSKPRRSLARALLEHGD